MSSIRSRFLSVKRFGLKLETSCVGYIASPEISCLPNLTTCVAYEFQPAFNHYLETLVSSPVRNLKELVEWNRQHTDTELPKGTCILAKFAVGFYPDTRIEHPSQSYLENVSKCKISATENANTLASLRKIAGPDGIDKVLNLFELDAVAALADSPISSVASAAGEFLQARLYLTKAKHPSRLSRGHDASRRFGRKWATIWYQHDY